MSAQGAVPEPKDEFVWLIERGQPLNQRPAIWWTGHSQRVDEPYSAEWTADAWKARRFITRAEAEAVIEAHNPPAGRARRDPLLRWGIAVEHGFIAAQSALDEKGAAT